MTENKDKQDEKPVYKPNRAQRRRKKEQPRLLTIIYKCGRCGLRYLAPTEKRCQCPVPKPGRKGDMHYA
jgi:hypothetical protein